MASLEKAAEAKPESKAPTYEVLEEDDEFEEFAEKDWDETAEDPSDAVQFTEDWEDTEIDDDFTNQLRKELAK
eukprot:CAMPEP_0172582880 /NCGR_PEP_ID=MMETSP1068-20121228/2432_1 /TAXON_ID=35684 /ORGANISM="Pseudopedinella elastica, Strain CCMP716" /LENGTH=72 /DNA_ID=CAMNT_0013376445 /DNA_START=85 /DNA_END=303 /DNA_ORIENTATION=-